MRVLTSNRFYIIFLFINLSLISGKLYIIQKKTIFSRTKNCFINNNLSTNSLFTVVAHKQKVIKIKIVLEPLGSCTYQRLLNQSS